MSHISTCRARSRHAASNYLSYEPATQKFTLPPEQAMVFAKLHQFVGQMLNDLGVP
jgi:hypothetical protein